MTMSGAPAMSIAAYKREKESKMSSLRIPDFARLHAMENERAARWKERNNKPPTVPKGFRLTNFQNGQAPGFPEQPQRPSIKDGKDETTNAYENGRSNPPVSPFINAADSKQANRQEALNGQIGISTLSTGSKFVNKVKEARVAGSKVNDFEPIQTDLRPEDAVTVQNLRSAAAPEKGCTSADENRDASDGAGTGFVA